MVPAPSKAVEGRCFGLPDSLLAASAGELGGIHHLAARQRVPVAVVERADLRSAILMIIDL
jgi:hypothetical protein